MSRSLHAAHRPFRAGLLPAFRQWVSNFFRETGFRPAFAQTLKNRAQTMPASTHHHRIFFSLPRDYIHRRRLRRRMSNAILIPLLSGVAAYFITRPTGGSGFSIPKSAQQTALATTTNPVSLVPASAPISGDRLAAGKTEGSTADSMISGAYKLADGPHTVTEVPDIVLHDAKRDKDLHVRVFYPNDPGPYPVIVFSHGAGGSQSCCDGLTRHWATYGYVTLQPTHEDSTVQRRNAGEEDINFLVAVRDALKKPALWQSRPKDISFVLDSLPVLQKRVPALSGKMDVEHIGVGGHSM